MDLIERDLKIDERIYSVRGRQVMIDRDLALLYGVETKQLNRAVKRNIERFPDDFMFQLTAIECSRCQIGTLNITQGQNLKYMPYAFTEYGIAMLSGILRSRNSCSWTSTGITRSIPQSRSGLSQRPTTGF